MSWTRRVDKRVGDMAHGITFVMYERSGATVRGEATTGTTKIHVNGRASLTLAFNQHKYGDELIAQIFTKEAGRVLARRADGWTRIQVYLGPADEATAHALENAAAIIRQRAGKRLDSRTQGGLP